MNYLHKISIIGSLLVLIGSCQPKKETEAHHHHAASADPATTGPVADLEKQILAVHDSVMPQMSNLMRFQKEVSAKVAQADGATKEQGLRISQQLKEADAAMMDWMHYYNGDTLKKLDQVQALAYLKAQQVKVNTMRRLMRNSLTDAETYLKK